VLCVHTCVLVCALRGNRVKTGLTGECGSVGSRVQASRDCAS
jgi:hypothetical protein